LLNRFQQFASTAKVNHPSNPTLSQEKEFARSLAVKDPKTLNAIEALLDQREEAATNSNLDENSRAAIDDLSQAAEQFEASAV
jgi:hypothetical protein